MSRPQILIMWALALTGTGFMFLFAWAMVEGRPSDVPFIKGLLMYIMAMLFAIHTKKGK